MLHLIEKDRFVTGSVVQMFEAAKGLAANGHEVWVGGRSGGDLESACGDADLPFIGLRFRNPADPESAWRLRRHLRGHDTDFIHVHKGRAHGVALLAAIGLGRFPQIVVNRGVSFPLDAFNKWKYRHPRVRAVVCVADAVRDIVIRSGGLHPGRVRTIHGSTDPKVFDPARTDGARVRAELGIDPGDFVIGQVSVRDWKGWTDLVTAFARTAARTPAAHLVLIGCDPESERSKVDTKAVAVGVKDLVTVLPYRKDIPDILAACDIVVDASWAGTGITGTIREAMALERAIVATDCGGSRELVIDGEVGLVVPPRDVDALADALWRLIGDADLRSRLGKAARQRVIEHFSTQQRIDTLEALYRSILK
jgi:glycosyltransferase involved in cell wall biosynthesis